MVQSSQAGYLEAGRETFFVHQTQRITDRLKAQASRYGLPGDPELGSDTGIEFRSCMRAYFEPAGQSGYRNALTPMKQEQTRLKRGQSPAARAFQSIQRATAGSGLARCAAFRPSIDRRAAAEPDTIRFLGDPYCGRACYVI